MLRSKQILVSRLGLAVSGAALSLSLVSCGQTGALYLPTDAAAANRATLPATLILRLPATPQPAPQSSPQSPQQPAMPISK